MILIPKISYGAAGFNNRQALSEAIYSGRVLLLRMCAEIFFDPGPIPPPPGCLPSFDQLTAARLAWPPSWLASGSSRVKARDGEGTSFAKHLTDVL